jgi:hypothetical protein
MALENISTGLLPNDGTGDSIRVAFFKTNNNFAYLGEAVNNLTTGNLSATGNISLNSTTASYWTGTFFLNGAQVATVTNLFGGGTVGGQTFFTSNVDATAANTGAVQLPTGGLYVGGNILAGNITGYGGTFTGPLSSPQISGVFATFLADTATGNLTTTGYNITSGNITGANVSASIQLTAARGVLTSGLTVGNITMTGSMTAQTTSNISAGNVNATNTLSASNLSGTLRTASQPNVTFVGNLITANVTGNLIAGNISSGIGKFNNLSVDTIPTNKSVTNKSYVTATVVGFAIGLGS